MFIYWYFDEVKNYKRGSLNHHKALKMAAGRPVYECEIWLYNGWLCDFEWLG